MYLFFLLQYTMLVICGVKMRVCEENKILYFCGMYPLWFSTVYYSYIVTNIWHRIQRRVWGSSEDVQPISLSRHLATDLPHYVERFEQLGPYNAQCKTNQSTANERRPTKAFLINYIKCVCVCMYMYYLQVVIMIANHINKKCFTKYQKLSFKTGIQSARRLQSVW